MTRPAPSTESARNQKFSDYIFWELPLMVLGMIGGIVTFALVSNQDGHLNLVESLVLGLTLAWIVVWGAVGVWRVGRYLTPEQKKRAWF